MRHIFTTTLIPSYMVDLDYHYKPHMNDFSPTVSVYTCWTFGNTKSTVQVTKTKSLTEG